MINVVEFFKNLPKKTCSKCGKAIKEEQSECYINNCENCRNKEN